MWGGVFIKLKNVLIVVKEIEKSKQFYKELFGLDVVLEQEGNVILTEGLVLQDADIWSQAVDGNVQFQNHAMELYFEERNFDEFLEVLKNYHHKIPYATPVIELPGGKRIVRIYDPDGTLIEIGTP